MFGNTYSKFISSKIQELLQIKDYTSGWKLENQGNIFSIFSMKYLNNQINLAKIEGVIPTKFENAVQYYQNGLQNKGRQQTCGEFEYLEKIDDNTDITLGRLRRNLLFSTRDLLTVQHKHYLNDEEVLITRTDIDSHPFYIPNPNFIKADTKVYGIFLKKVDSLNTHLEAYLLYDLRGRIPNSIQNCMIKHNVEVFINDIKQIQQL